MSVDGTGQKGQQRSYTYTYDKLLRLKDAIYADRSPAGGSWGNFEGYDEKNITYDQNGNITALKRNALIGSVVSAIDDLQYTYDGNRLKNVTDGTGGSYVSMGFKNLAGSSADYTYNDDGHITDDPKKGITTSVNLLQRAETVIITSATGRYLTYTYDAAGTLIRKQQLDNNILQKTTDYLNGFVYENSALAYFSVPEGRVRNAAGTLINEYIVTDQQGNTRVTFENNGGTARVIQENSYYPFGLVMSGSTVALSSTPVKKLYNGGSEWQNDFADLPDLMQTFYRDYDAALDRWTGVDPDAGATESISTYHYAGNNPIMINDPLGNEYTRNTESWDRFTHTPRYSADWVDINSWQVQMGYNPRYDEDTIEAYIKKNGTTVYNSKTDKTLDLISIFLSLDVINSSQYDEKPVSSDNDRSEKSANQAVDSESNQPQDFTRVDPASFKLRKINDAYYVNMINVKENYELQVGSKVRNYTVNITVLGIQVRSRDRNGRFLSANEVQGVLAVAYDNAASGVNRLLSLGLIKTNNNARMQFIGIFNTQLKLYFPGQSQAFPRQIPGAYYSEISYKPNRY